MADREGLKAALRITDEQLVDLYAWGRDQQLSLLPLDADEFDPDGGDGQDLKRGLGRPKGALNKTTQWWRDRLLGKYGSPLEHLASIYARPVGLLAKEIGCDLFEALKLQMLAAKELAPYVHQKLPVQVDLGDKGLVNLIINVATERGAGRQADDGMMTIEMVPIENTTKSEG